MLVLGNHFVWFSYFTDHYWFKFQEVASFFIVCVWAVPFMLFVSLSASENTLPSVANQFLSLFPSVVYILVSTHDLDPNSPLAENAKRRGDKFGSIVKSLLNVVLAKKDELLPTKSGQVKAF